MTFRLGLIALLAGCTGSPEATRRQEAPAPDPSHRPAPRAEADPLRPARARPDHYVTNRTRFAALGSVVSLGDDEHELFSPAGFEPLPKPRPGDWLAEHPEPGQSFPDYIEQQHLRPDGTRKYLYMVPVGDITAGGGPAASELARFAELYFDLPTKVMRPLDPEKLDLIWRTRDGNQQLHARSVLNMLKKRIPDDAFLMIAVTEVDLYPDDDWNFVFGMATFRDRVGVYSVARYNPLFYKYKLPLPDIGVIALRRTINVMAHEIGHMYGLQHCVYYRCAMNGSNSLRETDQSPLHLCPVCLRKLRRGAGFDLHERYKRLGRFYRKRDLIEEARWIEGRLER